MSRDLAKRAEEAFSLRYGALARETDRLFARLFVFQWLLAGAFAFAFAQDRAYEAVFLGGVIAAAPVLLVLRSPGAALNRMVAAVSQILFSALFIHLTGGRIETHFHVFGSLALLALYRDWRPVSIGTAVAALDHLARGAFWPQSLYGASSAAPWRALEHMAWVLFEDGVLFYSIRLALRELRSVCESQIGLEDKTEQLALERNQVKLLLDVAVIANQSKTPAEAMEKTLDRICQHSGWPVGHAYVLSPASPDLLLPAPSWSLRQPERFDAFREATDKRPLKAGEGLPGRVLKDGQAHWIDDVTQDPNFPRNEAGTDFGVRAGFGFPIPRHGKVVAVLEFFSEEVSPKDEAFVQVVSHVSQQIGQVFERAKVSEILHQANNAVKELNQSLEEKVLERTRELEDSQQKVLVQQQTLVASSKMSALGEMAGGVAHEINNPLATIKSLSGQLQEVVDDDPLDRALVKGMAAEVEKTTDRIAKIVQGLRSFSRDGSGDPFSPVNVRQMIEETLSFCSERFKSHGTKLVVEDFDKDLSFEGRATEISQVILNLLNNAHDAISGLGEKWIRVSVADEKEWLAIQVTDCGGGIPAEVRERIFQPFFTTKEIGKGTGLGLSLSIGLVKGHHGELTLDAECRNTRFVVRLPKKQKRLIAA